MFIDRLTATLSLNIGSDSYPLVAGQVERFEIDAHTWGFDAAVTFYVSAEQETDPIFEAFSGSALIAVGLAFGKEAEGDDTSAALSFTGYAVSKAVCEVVGESLKGAPVIGRRYDIQFVDAARAFWTQHRPLDLFVDASMQDMLDVHKPVGVDIDYDWSAVTTKQAVLTLGLDGEADASFYDFLLAWVDRNQGVFEFDATKTQYRLGGKKTKAAITTPLCADDISQLRALFPEPPRFTTRVLQSFADAPLTRELPNPLAAGIRRDVVMRTPIVADVDRRCQLESARLRVSAPGIEVTFRRCPEVLTGPLGFVSVADGFSERIYPAGTSYRVTRLRASAAHKPETPVEPEDSSAVYQIELVLNAEDQLNAVASLPPYRDARRTLRVEGKIVSAGGAGQRSWAAIENEDNSLWMYKVQIPLFNKEVPAPFAPIFTTGHFFFPAYKDQRVLVDLDFDRAAITGFLDWADEGRLPSDSQGNQIVLGFQSTNGTVVRHNYVDAIPVLTVERKASIETSTLTLGDGTLKISLEQSSAVPTSIPLYDVSPRVDAAKDAVIGEVGGSVTVVTTQFEGAVSQVSSSVEATSAAVQEEIAGAERTLGAQLDSAETELQGMLADASAATASLSMASTRAKARLLTAIQSVAEVRAPLLALQARVQVFSTSATGRSKDLKAEIAQLPDVTAAPLALLAQRAAALRVRASDRIRSLKAAVESVGPRANAGPFSQLTRFRQDAQALDGDITQFPSQLDTQQDGFLRELSADWLKVDAGLTAARAATQQSLTQATQTISATHSQITAKLQRKLAVAGPAAAGLQQRLAALQTSAQTNLIGQRSRAEAALSTLATSGTDARTQLTNSADGARQSVQQGLSALAATVHAVMSSLDSSSGTLLSTAQTLTDTISASVSTLEKAVIPPLDAVPAGIATAQASIVKAAKTAQAACDSALSAIDTLLANLDAAVTVPIKTALTAVDAAETTAQSTVQTVSQTVDTTLATATSAVQGFVTTFQTLVDGAVDALTTVRGLVRGAGGQIMPPIDALESLVEQLQSIFQTGINLLTAFVDKAHAVLDAIPAASLPKAAVQPAITAIGSALDAVMPLIQAGAKTAGDQLTSLATTLAGQVQTAEDTAVQAVSTFVSTLTQQIDAVLPPVREQLAGVQTQIDNAIEQVLTQVDNATTAAVSGITQTFAAVGARAQTAVTAATTQLDNADAQLDQTVSALRAQIASQREQLSALAAQLAQQIAAGVDAAGTQLDTTAQQIEQAISNGRSSLQAQVDAAVAAAEPRVTAARTQLSQVPATLDQRLQPLREHNTALVAAATQRIPKAADIDAAANTALEPLLAALTAIDQEIGRL